MLRLRGHRQAERESTRHAVRSGALAERCQEARISGFAPAALATPELYYSRCGRDNRNNDRSRRPSRNA